MSVCIISYLFTATCVRGRDMSSRVPANCFHNLLFFHLITRDFGLNYFQEKQNNIQRLFILNNGDFERSDLIKEKYFRDGKY